MPVDAECRRAVAPHGSGSAEDRWSGGRHGDADAQTMCINGAMEALSDYRPEAALAACRGLAGEGADTCRNAIQSKRYGLAKPFHLYYSE